MEMGDGSWKPTNDESEWPPYSRDRPEYFIFNAEKSGLGKGLRTTSCAFWNEFLPRLKGVPEDSRFALHAKDQSLPTGQRDEDTTMASEVTLY
ncbi:hypothetical protein HZH66_013327 [Vespula vulgaris]|uniref:Uncharacterized protein n=1 Tax=Vespula vulgaris TaxID=7454 RepID=A0A834MSH4_VESVU|nr:hypothetical protein HZH66_013327 [Vespula vulgaris]